MFPSLKAITISSLCVIIAACGGGGGSSDSSSADSADKPAVMLPTMFTVDGRSYNSCASSVACSGNPYAPFNVYDSEYSTTTFPSDGATLSGIVHLQVNGLAMENVELLPETGYDPKVGVFALANDKTNATLDFDTTTLPNGPVKLRISGFNAPAGQDGVERSAMSPRLFYINNPTPRAQLTAQLASAPGNGATLSQTTRLEVRGTGLANVELLPAQGYKPSYGKFNVSADRTRAWLDFDPRALPDGARNVRISAFNVMAGQPGAQEIVVMSPRTWQLATGATSDFTAAVESAPVHGAKVRGIITLEVRGTGMKNVELLPASGYTPKLGQFQTNFQGTFAYLNIDTRTLPNGPFTVRIAAFSSYAGEPGKEITAMPTREWIIDN